VLLFALVADLRAAAGGQQIAVALYDFAGEQEGDLSFNAGDQIVILDMSGTNYFHIYIYIFLV
jgi:hypothetical protein